MTELLFQHDAYIKSFDAVVTDVGEDAVALDSTAFFPSGGGQPSDHGALFSADHTWPVLKVRKAGGEVWHQLEGGLPSVGSQVTGEIDWERRYQLMRTHTAMHVLCGVIWRDYSASVTGG